MGSLRRLQSLQLVMLPPQHPLNLLRHPEALIAPPPIIINLRIREVLLRQLSTRCLLSRIRRMHIENLAALKVVRVLYRSQTRSSCGDRMHPAPQLSNCGPDPISSVLVRDFLSRRDFVDAEAGNLGTGEPPHEGSCLHLGFRFRERVGVGQALLDVLVQREVVPSTGLVGV